MKSIKNYDLSDIHLFEVSILGEGRLWRARGEDYLIIPCYRMELLDGRIRGYSYFLFEGLASYRYELMCYEEGGKVFSGEKVTGSAVVKEETSARSDTLSNIGLLMGRKGWLAYHINYNRLHLLYSDEEESPGPMDYDRAMNDSDIIDFLILKDCDLLIPNDKK